MKVRDIIKNNDVTVSFEVFPPKEWGKVESTKAVISELAKFSPSFMSVTYGAAGTTSGFTTEIANSVKENGITPLAHLTCLTSTRDKIHTVVNEMKANGIENILALRGDINPEIPPKNEFRYASDLVSFIKERGDYDIAGACYPEGHIEAEDMITDIHNLKKKVEAGADHLISQLFFDNAAFYQFQEKAKIAGITVPIEAGIMPVINKS